MQPTNSDGRPINRRRGRRLQIAELIAELQDIHKRYGNTVIYVNWADVGIENPLGHGRR
ncbi:MAG: hypothetical protein KGL39_20520 [Patescibacteria group bacterium]|nr:hypothetical protein [Patescibacteria group bacterium]